MRGRADDQPPLFHVFDVEARIRPDHPLRDVKRRADRILAGMTAQFSEAYSATGRPGAPPERLLKALLLRALYAVRSGRQLGERIDTALLFRGCLDLRPSEEAFDATAFARNRRRLDGHGLATAFFDAVVAEALTAGLCGEPFGVDGTRIESHASATSFQPKDDPPDVGGGTAPTNANAFQPRNVGVDFRRQKRTNETHRSKTDPEAKVYRKSPGQEAKLAHMGHVLSDNRHGLVLGAGATEASGTAERPAAVAVVDGLKARHGRTPRTLGADKGYDCGEFYRDVASRGIEPLVPLVKAPRDAEAVASKKHRPGVEARPRMKARMAGDGYRLSRKCRKKVEECFGRLKTIAGLGRIRTVGRWKLRQVLEIGAAAFNSVRLRTLQPA